MDKLKARKTKPGSYNLDLNLVGDYWGWFGGRYYHHTNPREVKHRDSRVLVNAAKGDSLMRIY